jgi:hypothetical protein
LLTPALTSSPSSAAALVKVGTVLTHDLLILKLPIAVVDPEDNVKDKTAENVVLLVVEYVVAVEVESVMLEEMRAWEVDVRVDVSVKLRVLVDLWWSEPSTAVAVTSSLDVVVAAALMIVDATTLADSPASTSSPSPVSSVPAVDVGVTTARVVVAEVAALVAVLTAPASRPAAAAVNSAK